MSEPSDDDRTGQQRIPIAGTSPDTLSNRTGEVEDYEDLHSTFLGGSGSYHPYARVMESTEDYGDPPMPSLLRLFLVIAGIACMALAGPVWWVIDQINKHMAHAASSAPAETTFGPAQNSGYVFAVIVVIVVVIVAARGAARWFKGE